MSHWRFARSWARCELGELRRGDWRRPSCLIILAGTLEMVLLAGLAGGLVSNGVSGALVAGAVALVLAPPLVALLQVAMVARGYRHALRTWFLDTPPARWGAQVTLKRGQWWLYDVHAAPTGHGHGTTVMEQVCAAADDAGAELHLRSSGPSATRFYRRHGFTQVRGRHLSRPPTTARQ